MKKIILLFIFIISNIKLAYSSRKKIELYTGIDTSYNYIKQDLIYEGQYSNEDDKEKDKTFTNIAFGGYVGARYFFNTRNNIIGLELHTDFTDALDNTKTINSTEKETLNINNTLSGKVYFGTNIKNLLIIMLSFSLNKIEYTSNYITTNTAYELTRKEKFIRKTNALGLGFVYRINHIFEARLTYDYTTFSPTSMVDYKMHLIRLGFGEYF